MKIIDIYVEHLLQNPDDELKKFFEKGLYKTKRDISRFSLSTKTARTHKPRYESRTVEEIEGTARGESRSRIGDKCISNRDCESEYCLEGKCAEDLSMYD